MIKIDGSDIAHIANQLNNMLLDDTKKFNSNEFSIIISAIRLLEMMYYHDPRHIKKDNIK